MILIYNIIIIIKIMLTIGDIILYILIISLIVSNIIIIYQNNAYILR